MAFCTMQEYEEVIRVLRRLAVEADHWAMMTKSVDKKIKRREAHRRLVIIADEVRGLWRDVRDMQPG